jgi:hypothetical protein
MEAYRSWSAIGNECREIGEARDSVADDSADICLAFRV